MYFFDPHHGRRRRMMVENQVEQFLVNFGRGVDAAVQDIQDRAISLADEVTGVASHSSTRTRTSDPEANDRSETECLSPGMRVLVGAAGLAFGVHLTRRPGLILGALGLAALGAQIASAVPASADEPVHRRPTSTPPRQDHPTPAAV
jgi:hypothetical protein